MAITTKLIYKGLKANLPASRNADSFYLCTDTRELFFGADLYTEPVRFYNGEANKPAAPAQGVLYIDEATGKGEVWNGAAWKVAVAPLKAADNSVEIGGTAAAPTIKAKISEKDGNRLVLATDEGKEGLFVAPADDPDTYKVEEAETAETGYLKTYVLNKYPKGDENETPTECGKINIPKDYLVKSASIKTVETEDDPYEGAKVGDKYIDFVVNTKDADADATKSHIYLPVNDLVDVYTSGDGIEITDANVVKVKIDTANANGLEVGADGLKLNVAVANDNTGENGKAGAMSAEDKTNLDKVVECLTIGTF